MPQSLAHAERFGISVVLWVPTFMIASNFSIVMLSGLCQPLMMKSLRDVMV